MCDIVLHLSREDRWAACVHEAAHAVIFALGGVFVYSVSVLNQGDHNLNGATLTGRKGESVKGKGLCCTSGNPAALFLRWDKENGGMIANRDGFKAMASQLEKLSAKKKWLGACRSHLSGLLAGPIADQILKGEEEVSLEVDDSTEMCDLQIAEAMCLLLPYRNEFEHLARETEGKLRDPKTWGRVVKLAKELEHAGALGDNDSPVPFLPAPLKNWPKSPRRSPA